MYFLLGSKWLGRLAWLVLLLAALVWWWHWMYPVAQFRYKLTVEVMTPDGLKSGSSVIEVRYQNVYSLSGVPNLRLSAQGEAVFLPVGGKRLFAVTLTNGEAKRGRPEMISYDSAPGFMRGALNVHSLPLKAFRLTWKNFDEDLLMAQVHALSAKPQRFDAPFPNLPTLVVFKDVNDPDSVRVVQPGNLAAELGEGYALQNVWLEFTAEPPTDTGMKLFPWWEEKITEQRSIRFHGQGQSLINNIVDYAFRRPGIWDNSQ